MDQDVTSMATRIEVTKQLRADYRAGTKAEKRAILDRFCASTGAGRSTARRYLASETIGIKDVVVIGRRQHRPTKYSRNAHKQLIRVWPMMGMASGKYMAALMPDWLDQLEAHHELVLGAAGYDQTVRDQLVAMSAATIDRYLQAERHRLRPKGISRQASSIVTQLGLRSQAERQSKQSLDFRNRHGRLGPNRSW